jgi:chromosome segregation ATPase
LYNGFLCQLLSYVIQRRSFQAKSRGEQVKKSKEVLKERMSTIERLRRDIAINQLYKDGEAVTRSQQEEEGHLKAIEVEKRVYSEAIERIKYLKEMIENVQDSLERSRAEMQMRFDDWYSKACQRQAKTDSLSIEAQRNTQEKTIFNHPPGTHDVELPPGVVLTGDKETDEDIIAFYRAKRALLGR